MIALTWVTPRFLWTLGAVALLLACAPGAPAFVVVATILTATLLFATMADAVTGPPRAELRVARVATEHLALRKTVDVKYTFENRSAHPIRVGIVETPVRTLRFIDDEALADVGAQSAATIARRIARRSGSRRLRAALRVV